MTTPAIASVDDARRLGPLLGRLTAPLASEGGRTVAVAAIHRGADSSDAVRQIGKALTTLTARKVLMTNIDRLETEGSLEAEVQPDRPATAVGLSSQQGGIRSLNRFDQILKHLSAARHSYDMVLVDCPPLEDSLDTRRVCAEVDGVVLVARAGQTRMTDINRLARELSEMKANVLGVVLTGREYPIPNWIYRVFGRSNPVSSRRMA